MVRLLAPKVFGRRTVMMSFIILKLLGQLSNAKKVVHLLE